MAYTFSFVDKVVLQKRNRIMCIYGTNGAKQPTYAFVEMNTEQINAMADAIDAGQQVDVNDFGEVLYRGDGAKPDGAAKAYMREHHEMDAGF